MAVGEAVRLSKVIQGVEFTVVEQDIVVKAVVPRETLQSVFGASDEPDSWMNAYETHADAIDCAAADAYRASPHRQAVVVLQAHLGPHEGSGH